MFSDGQKIFALIFIIAFIGLIGYQYYLDRKKNVLLFKNTYWVILAVIGFMIGYVLLSKIMY